MLWERMIQHSIRADFKDGFILPYHAAITKAAADPEFDPAELAALSPADRLLEFSSPFKVSFFWPPGKLQAIWRWRHAVVL